MTGSRSSGCAARNCGARYRSLAAQVIAECDGPADADDLPFRLVESVINRRSDDTDCPDEQPWVIADGALRTLGFDGDFAALRKHRADRVPGVTEYETIKFEQSGPDHADHAEPARRRKRHERHHDS